MPAPRPIAVLFDLDGTLVDTVPFILAAVRHAFDGYGSCPSDAQWIAGIGTPLRTQLAGFARRAEDVDVLFRRYRAYWLAEHDRMTRCFPGALELVAGLAARGHPLGVVTAKVEEGAWRTLRHTGLDRYMGAVIGADSCPRAKPDPEPVRLALARLGRAPEEALMIGDSPHDLVAGRRAGVRTVAALWGACSAEALAAAEPDHLAAALGELAALVHAA
ncbi:HAD family hydrolase [Anaeromyxobacter oryzisoli]|uniref:HAD family hydrolase n=1 Tax=Anaeromyxobacter oryzisoli TaxID=2925408 RepID=UPI001F56FDC3|nr:HAD-IA family hydrolase [Anaeromyxobacter sp. SG63]